METSEKLREKRLSLSLTQSGVANKAKMSTVQYNGYETGRHEPSEKTMVRIARALGVNPDMLWGSTDEPTEGSIERKLVDLKQEIATSWGIDVKSVKISINIEIQ
jgi:transcriptional regulator with XRE-family HTH domain